MLGWIQAAMQQNTIVHIHKYFGGRRVAAAVVSENNETMTEERFQIIFRTLLKDVSKFDHRLVYMGIYPCIPIDDQTDQSSNRLLLSLHSRRSVFDYPFSLIFGQNSNKIPFLR